ncbi:hypothetical protein PCANC_12526, partial [Puccinia coronata f. sp. avenae]
MILILHSLARLVWGVALAHAGPPEERQVGRLYHDASLAINPGVANQKRPAGNQVDIHDSEDYLDPEAHVTPFHWRTFDPESLRDSKRHKRGQFEAASGRCSKSHLRHDFLSLGIAPSTSSLRMPPGTSQASQRNQIDFIFEDLSIKLDPRPQDASQNELHHIKRKSTFIDFFEQSIQENSQSHFDARTDGQKVNK